MTYFEKLSHTTTESASLLRKVVAYVVSAARIGLALMFLVMLFAVVATAGAVAWGYLWWRTRDLRKQMRKQMRKHPPGGVVSDAGQLTVGAELHIAFAKGWARTEVKERGES